MLWPTRCERTWSSSPTATPTPGSTLAATSGRGECRCSSCPTRHNPHPPLPCLPVLALCSKLSSYIFYLRLQDVPSSDNIVVLQCQESFSATMATTPGAGEGRCVRPTSSHHFQSAMIDPGDVGLQAGLKRLQAASEQFVAANWPLLKMDCRLTHDLEAESLCRIHQMASWMIARPIRHSPGRVTP
jgi:hypothetical protein